MSQLKLFMLLVGCKPAGRFTEQHDVFFGIAASLKELVPHLQTFWPEANGNMHVDAWREITSVGEFTIRIALNNGELPATPAKKLFFLNLGGYKPGEFEEFHYKLLVVAGTSGEAIQQARSDWFYKTMGFEGAVSHIDDKYGVDVDDVYAIEDILAPEFKSRYRLEIISIGNKQPDPVYIGYLPLRKI